MLHGVIKKKLCPERGHLGEMWSLAFLWAFDFYFFLTLIRCPSSLKCNDLYICPHLQVQSLGGDTNKNCLVREFPWGAGVKTKSHSSLNKWLHAEGCNIWKKCTIFSSFCRGASPLLSFCFGVRRREGWRGVQPGTSTPQKSLWNATGRKCLFIPPVVLKLSKHGKERMLWSHLIT